MYTIICVQLTAENFEEAVSNLTSIVAQSENNQAEQTSENLDTVANYFNNLERFVTSSNVKIDSNVSLCASLRLF